MKAKFPPEVEDGRDQISMPFATRPGSRFGLFRFKSPFTGATLRCIVCSADLHESEEKIEDGWDHVSVSKVDKVPTWQEMCFVKDLFFDDTETVVQYHPPKADYVNIHENVLHLWSCPKIKFPMPPKECV